MFPRLLLISFLLLHAVSTCLAQDVEKASGPRTELLTINGGKPNLTAAGDGITSYKGNGVYQKGKMTVRLVKRAEQEAKIQLPIGYTLFGDTMYQVQSDAEFGGWGDVTFKLPSAGTKETFAQLRILYPEFDTADPEVLKWVDATFDDSSTLRESLTEAAIKERLPDFKSRTLHALFESQQSFFIVALRDSTKTRNKMTVDLELTGSGAEQLTEGRAGQYELKITNRGPDAATGVVLDGNTSYIGFSFVSAEVKQAKCRVGGSRFYCKLPSLEKDQSIDVKIFARSEWTQESRDSKPEERGEHGQVGMMLTVKSTEQDLSTENNELHLTTAIYWDANKGPIIEPLTPRLFQIFPGPGASVPISFKASDPDGFIKKVEVFDDEKLLGQGTMKSEGEYEVVLTNVAPGRHRMIILATDNLGRTSAEDVPEFFVNGPAKVEITSPAAGSILSRSDGDVTITIHATSASSSLKKVSLDLWEHDATPIGNDNYVVKVKSCSRKCRLQAIAIDKNGHESRSEYVEFIVASTPTTKMYWHDGEYLRDFEPGKPLKVQNGLTLHASAVHTAFNEADIVKTEIFVDGVLVCTTNESTRYWHEFNCVWRPSPGRYKLHALATDEDGMIGKSEVIEVVIERP